MDLKEALRSNKLFRRPSCKNNPTVYFVRLDDGKHGLDLIGQNGRRYPVEISDILATDWEIKTDDVIFINEYPDGYLTAHRTYNQATLSRNDNGITKKYILVEE